MEYALSRVRLGPTCVSMQQGAACEQVQGHSASVWGVEVVLVGHLQHPIPDSGPDREAHAVRNGSPLRPAVRPFPYELEGVEKGSGV